MICTHTDPALALLDAYEKGARLGQGAHGCAFLVTRIKDGKQLVRFKMNKYK